MVRTANMDHEKAFTVHHREVVASSVIPRLAVTVTTEVPTLPVHINLHTPQQIAMSVHIQLTITASQRQVLAYLLIQPEAHTNPISLHTLPMEIQQITMVIQRITHRRQEILDYQRLVGFPHRIQTLIHTQHPLQRWLHHCPPRE